MLEPNMNLALRFAQCQLLSLSNTRRCFEVLAIRPARSHGIAERWFLKLGVSSPDRYGGAPPANGRAARAGLRESRRRRAHLLFPIYSMTCETSLSPTAVRSEFEARRLPERASARNIPSWRATFRRAHWQFLGEAG